MSVTNLSLLSPGILAYRSLPAPAVDELAARFRAAKPFPYLQISDFLQVSPEEVLPEFPTPEWGDWHRFKDHYQYQKMYYNDIDGVPPSLRALILDLCSPAFLRFLEKVTGIEALLPDPYLDGGGLHCSGPGGILAPHTDFHINQRLQLFRRLNVLLYLNQEWEQEYGGCLELYKKGSDSPAVTVVPKWGTRVIFRTDDDSLHGFSKPIVGDRWRRSIALYYYTSAEAARFSGDRDTHWKTHGKLSGLGSARLKLYQSLMRCSRLFSSLAHRANPYLGLGAETPLPNEKRDRL